MSLFTEFDHYHLPIGADGTPYEHLEALRDEAVESGSQIHWSEKYGGFWVVSGWQASRTIHHDTENFSSRESVFPHYGTPGDSRFMLAEMDPPEHKKYRRVVNTPFSPVNILKVDAAIRKTVNAYIDKFIDAGAVDFCDVLGDHVPADVTALLLGLPAEHGPSYRRWTHAMAQGIHTEPEKARAELREMGDYWNEVVEEKRRNPTDDVLSLVVHGEADGERLNEEDLRDFFTILLLGGIDNTARWLANIFWRLAWDVELRRRLVSQPELVPLAVEEFLRVYGPALVFRLVNRPVELHGVKMEPGQVVGLIHPLCNRDPAEFSYPDVFIPDRAPNRHLGLGLGIHRCLGLHLVKVEARAVIEEVLRRMPEFALDSTKSTEWVSGQVGAMVRVPIVFPPGGGLRSVDEAATAAPA